MALKGPRVFYEYMSKVVKYWHGAEDCPRPVAWRLTERTEDSGKWTVKESRLHGLVSAHIQRRLNVEQDVRLGKEISLHSLTEAGVTDILVVSENHASAERNGTSPGTDTVKRTKELMEILKASLVARRNADSPPSTIESEKTGDGVLGNHNVDVESSGMEVEDERSHSCEVSKRRLIC